MICRPVRDNPRALARRTNYIITFITPLLVLVDLAHCEIFGSEQGLLTLKLTFYGKIGISIL